MVCQIDLAPLLKRWQFAYGVMACYGLRPHELWHLDLQDLMEGGWTIRVKQQTKTGARKVWPYLGEWVNGTSRRWRVGVSLP